MFSYYGSKTKLAHLYPAPIYPTIIEPFAGAAAYSLHSENWRRNVILYDSYPKIAAVWDYLINASEKDILSLPDATPGTKVTDFPNLSDAERYLMGFSFNPASSVPKITASKRAFNYRAKIIKNLHKIRRWKIINSSYETCPDLVATWFIDPPYQIRGKYYFGYSKIDYQNLADWCRSRKGQIIVCENEGATWLPFKTLSNLRGMAKSNTEAVWINNC